MAEEGEEEADALEIATNGLVEEVRDGDGALVSTRRRCDPQMVRFLLAARRPAIYSERARVEVAGVREPGDAEIQEALERFTASVV